MSTLQNDGKVKSDPRRMKFLFYVIFWFAIMVKPTVNIQCVLNVPAIFWEECGQNYKHASSGFEK